MIEVPPDPDVPFTRCFTTDSLGRRITFYVSKNALANLRKPAILLIQGSGCQSIWSQKPDGRISGPYQNSLLEVCRETARVVCVEKPGVQYLDWPKVPGEADEGRKEFLEEHTLDRWGEANLAALRAVHTMPDIDPTRTLVIGHSEGGIVAARVAAELPSVTHVAILAGGGPSQLFDFACMARLGTFGDPALGEQARVQSVYAQWAEIQTDPQSITRFAWGHPFRRWSGFLSSSTTAELLRSRVRVYLAHGTEDTAVSVVMQDLNHAELLARGRDVTVERIEGVDHGFRTKGEEGYRGVTDLFGRIVAWFSR